MHALLAVSESNAVIVVSTGGCGLEVTWAAGNHGGRRYLVLKPKNRSMDVMGFVSDHMGHFSPYDVPNVLFMIFMGALLGYGLARFGGRLSGRDARVLMLWSATAALAAAFVRAQLPLAVLFLALVLLVRMEPSTGRDRLLLFGALVLGLGCGSGAALIMFVAAIPYIALVRWSFPADKA